MKKVEFGFESDIERVRRNLSLPMYDRLKFLQDMIILGKSAKILSTDLDERPYTILPKL